MRLPLFSWTNLLRKLGFSRRLLSRRPRTITTAQLRREARVRLGFEELESRCLMDASMYISDATSYVESGNLMFNVGLTGMHGNVSVDYNTSNGSATAGSDYTATSGTLHFASWDLGKTISVPILSDTLDENNETFTVTLSNLNGATFSDSQAVGTINDDDVPPSVGFDPSSVTVGESAGTATFTVKLTGSTTENTVTVQYATGTNGSATAGSDFTAASGTLTFVGGDREETFTVPIINDTAYEFSLESFPLTLSNPTNAMLWTSSATGYITENDSQPVISINDVSVNESAGTAQFTVSLSNQNLVSSVTVWYATANDTATAGSDYTAINNTQLTFATGETQKTVNVSISNDTTDEVNETFFVNLSMPSGATIGDSQGVGTIVDNDGPTISINDVTVDEDDGTATFTVTLSAASPQTITVNYATANNTATAGEDYTQESATLTFQPNATSETVTIDITDDNLDESDETFNVNLTSATNATIYDDHGLGAILDDDHAPQAWADSYTLVKDTALDVLPTGILENDTDLDGDVLTASVVNGPSHAATFEMFFDGSFTYQPTSGWTGTDTFVYAASDGFNTSQATVTINVIEGSGLGTAPTTTGIADLEVNEDALDAVVPLYGSFADAETPDNALYLQIVANSNPSIFDSATIERGTFVEDQFVKLDFADNANGSADLTVRATDTDGLSVETMFTVTVNPVNDQPTLLGGSLDSLLVDDTSPTQVSLALSGLDFGPGGGSDESGQSLSFTVSSLPDSSIGTVLLADSVTPVTLSAYSWADFEGMVFEPVVGAFGATTFEFTVQDDGGTANGGVDSLDVQWQIYPDNGLPFVDIYASGPNAEEGGAEGEITLHRSGDLSSSLDVSYTVESTLPDTATPGEDYVSLSGTATFGVDEDTVVIPVVPIDDEIEDEPDQEFVTVELGDGPDYNIAFGEEPAGPMATVAIANESANAPPTIANPGDRTGKTKDTINLQIEASDPDVGDELKFLAVGLPTGLGFDNATRKITGTLESHAATKSPWKVTIFVTDGKETAKAEFTWTVSAKSALELTGIHVKPGLPLPAYTRKYFAYDGQKIELEALTNPSPAPAGTTFRWYFRKAGETAWGPVRGNTLDPTGRRIEFTLYAGLAPGTSQDYELKVDAIQGGAVTDSLTIQGNVRKLAAVPTNFHQARVSTVTNPEGAKVANVTYEWDSSTGRLGDFPAEAYVGEIVTYFENVPASGRFDYSPELKGVAYYPGGPFKDAAFSFLNPTLAGAPASDGEFADIHTPASNKRPHELDSYNRPLRAASFKATQYYAFKPDKSKEEYIFLSGPYTITRELFKDGDKWYLRLKKEGGDAAPIDVVNEIK